MKVTEEHPREYAWAYFTPQVTNVSASNSVDLKYNAETGTYTGSITITEDTYPCEWALTDLNIYDENDNHTYLYDFRKDYREMLPWYYKVYSKNTYREDVKTVNFQFYGFVKQDDGSYQPNFLISSKTVQNVGRRTSLEKIGVSLPQVMEGVNAKWYYGEPWWIEEDRSTEIDEDTELLFFNSYDSTKEITYALSAFYDKACANVSLTYMSKDNGVKTIMLPQFVDMGTTYREVLEALDLPEDADTEQFAGFELSDAKEDTKVDEDINYAPIITVQAKYNDCPVAWKVRYFDKDGKETSKVINKVYKEGTKVSDALAELDLPEDIDNVEFESWALAGDGAETISKPMAEMDAVAVYRGKTTVDAVYTYRGEDGKTASGKGMVLMDGEDLSDSEIEGAASDVFKEVTHFGGLRLSEWSAVIGMNQPRYKTVQFQAVYQNCVVTLKYPDDTIQYVVVDRNSKYTLPTENEKYKDVVWKGYAKGEAVTVAEDREFTVESYDLKGGTQEKPEGVKLSEDEIAKIKEEIENAKPGKTITVDMKKATVVPKEVLEAIQGKSVEIVLDMGDYSWTIGGTDVIVVDKADVPDDGKQDKGDDNKKDDNNGNNDKKGDNGQNNNKDDSKNNENADIEKKGGSITTNPGSITADSSYPKSPKTGE